jgi:hypothetical protein
MQVIEAQQFNEAQIMHWQKVLRIDLIDLIRNGSDNVGNGVKQLHYLTASLFNIFLDTVTFYRKKASMSFLRNFIPHDQRTLPDATCGFWSNFTSSGQKLANWPYWDKREAKTEIRNLLQKLGYEECSKPDWLKKKHPTLSEGVLTIMCVKSGVVCSSTFLCDHEGRKDCLAALWCYHPSPELIDFIISDTACMHAIFTAIRTGDFSHIRWILDKFHAEGIIVKPFMGPKFTMNSKKTIRLSSNSFMRN